GGGAINDFDPQLMPKPGGLLGVSGHGATQTRQNMVRQAAAGLAPTAGARLDSRALVQSKEGLDLADDLPTRAMRIKDLVEKTKESAAQVIDPISAVGALVSLSKQARAQPRAKELIEVKEAVLTEVLDTATQGGQPRAPGGKEGCIHRHSMYTVPALTDSLK